MTKALSTEVNSETLALLQESYPVEAGMNRIYLPRLGMVSQDQIEGKGKASRVVTEAGTFFIDKQTEEVDADGKKLWDREEIGAEIKGIILFRRKQLRLYDEATVQYTSSPVYDNNDEVLPLFCEKKEVARGTPEELKALYKYEEDGKTKSKLEENIILYVEYKGEVYQLNLRGSSMYSFLTYSRTVLPPSVVTKFSSESKEKGKIAWNQMTFSVARKLTQEEVESVVSKVQEIKTSVMLKKQQYKKADSSF